MLYRVTLKSGSSTPIVFLHGFLGCTRDWERVASEIDAPCIAVDLPGHGRSPFTAKWEEALNAVLPNEPVHLVGYSMGGRLALRYAIAKPQHIASLTLVGAHLGLKTESERATRRASDAIWAHKLRNLPLEEFLKEWYAQSIFKGFEAPAWRREQSNVEALAQALEEFGLGMQPDYSEQLPVGTRLVVGERDAAFRAHYQGIAHTIVPESGHAPHLEKINHFYSHLFVRKSVKFPAFSYE